MLSKKIVVILGDPNLPHSIQPDKKFSEVDGDAEAAVKLKEALSELKEYFFVYLDDHANMEKNLILHAEAFLFLNLCDEGFMNNPRREAEISEMLERLSLPYSGAGSACLRLCYDKAQILTLANSMGIPIPKTYPLDETKINFPVIVKPTNADGSYGITQDCVVHDFEPLLQVLNRMSAQFGLDKITIQEFLSGDDLSVGIIGNGDNLLVLPINMEDYSELPEGMPRICGYEAKWDPKSPYWTKIVSKRAILAAEVEAKIKEWSIQLFKLTKSLDYARIDWRLDANGTPKLLEINPNPGWCWDGHLAKMAGYAGMSYSEMLAAIIKAAI